MTMKLVSSKEFPNPDGTINCQFLLEITLRNTGYTNPHWSRMELLRDLDNHFRVIKNRIKNNSVNVILLDASGTSRISMELNDKYLPIFLKFMDK